MSSKQPLIPPTRGGSGGSVSSIDERRAEKKRAGRRLWLVRGAIAGGVVALIALIGWLLLGSPAFALRADSVEVTGADTAYSPDSTLETIASSTDVYEGTPLLRVPLDTLESEIMKNPNVDQVTVSRAWPRGLSVEVIPRVPSMMQRLEEGFDLLGPDGVSLGQVTDPYPGVPTVVLSGYGTDGVTREAIEAAEVWGALSQGLRDQVSVINVNGADITMQTTGGAEILWGTIDLSDVKSQVLEVLIAGREASIYNVMDPAYPSTR